MNRAALVVLVLTGFAACGAPAKPATTPTPITNAAPDQPTAPATAASGSHDARGVELAKQGKLDAAAAEYIAELKLTTTAPAVFGHLDAIYKQLSADRRKEIAALGTKDLPIKVPDIGFEYTWVAKFGCVDGAGKVGMQALVSGKTGQLDLLDYTCPDGSRHGAYFDFSDDPTEKAMREELGAQPKTP